MCFIIDEYAEFWEQRDQKARKPHKCYECRAEIPVGVVYRRYAWKFDGYFNTAAVCVKCESIRKAIHDRERSRGCAEHEAWCPIGELNEYTQNLTTAERDALVVT